MQAGLAIFDTMQYIPCDVNTVCFGMAASMGAFLLSAGTKGKRRSLPNSRIMIHQPSGGGQGEVNSEPTGHCCEPHSTQPTHPSVYDGDIATYLITRFHIIIGNRFRDICQAYVTHKRDIEHIHGRLL